MRRRYGNNGIVGRLGRDDGTSMRRKSRINRDETIGWMFRMPVKVEGQVLGRANRDINDGNKSSRP